MREGRDALDEALDRERRLLMRADEELIAYWNLWLAQAQATNDLDEALYSHGVFEREPAVEERGRDGR